MKIKKSIFKKYDVRGKFPDEISRETSFLIGRAFARYLRKNKKERVSIVLGREEDENSLKVQEGFVEGVLDEGGEVLEAGATSTPALYFAVSSFKAEGGVQITASHLPSQYTGFKMVKNKGVNVGKEELEEIRRMAEEKSPSREGGVRKKIDVKEKYVKELKKRLKDFPRPDLKVVMDAGNGMTSLYLEEVFSNAGFEIVPLFWRPDGNYPNRGSNVKLEENQKKAAAKVKKEKADFAFLWDGDGDRFYVLDDRGEPVDPNFVSLLIARDFVKNKKGKKVVVDIRTSRLVEEKVKEAGGEVIRTKAWHPEIKKKMREEGAVFGSETSGHFIFRDFYFIDDGILASIHFLNALGALKRDFNEVISKWKSLYQILPETNFRIENKKEAAQKLKRVASFYKEKGGMINWVDGVTVDFPDWRFNLRPSQTEPFLRLNMEARQGLDEKKREVEKIIS